MSGSDVKRAADAEELAPLVEFIKAGKLFDIQTWIKDGKPVNSPPRSPKGRRTNSPLDVAIERGFHSVVQVLLEGGAVQEPVGFDSPMSNALRCRRLDLVELLIKHGFDPQTVDMREVFDTWDPQIMKLFIEAGANLEVNNPFATALCRRIRTALRPFKDCFERLPTLREQANIALRYHCKEGNLKWVSLMLWAGADPWKAGTENPDEVMDGSDPGLSALGFAALYHHFDVFDLKPIRSKLAPSNAASFFSYLTRGKGLEVLTRLLEKGADPNDQSNGGSSAIQDCLNRMGWDRRYSLHSWEHASIGRTLDTEESRDRLKAIHLLAKHGGKWIPEDKRDLNSARRSLLYLMPDYTLEVVWIMGKFQGCSQDCIRSLISTPTMKSHLAKHYSRLQELLAAWS